jgi:hypothetical protein
MGAPDLAYAFSQARLQARFGMRPAASEWQHIAATRDLGALLQLLRDGSLARWTERLATRPAIHEIERRLREEWTVAVDEVAGWQPEPWRPATRWMRWIPYLPSLQKLARGGRAPAWMRADPVLGPIVAREPRERGPGLARTPLAPLSRGFGRPADVHGAWVKHWQSLWPDSGPARAPLERLLRTLRAHRTRIAAAPPEARSTDTLESLDRQLGLLFRRNPLSPAACAAYLCLLALDVRRLRGALAVRALRDAPVVPP